jgi:hypothetical protein
MFYVFTLDVFAKVVIEPNYVTVEPLLCEKKKSTRAKMRPSLLSPM